MDLTVPMPLKAAALRLGFVPGLMSTTELAELDNIEIVYLTRSMMGQRTLNQIFTYLAGGPLTGIEFMAIWENRKEFLGALQRLQNVYETLSEFSDLELVLTTLSKPEMITGLFRSGASEAAIIAAIEVMDPERLRDNLLALGVGVDIVELTSKEITPEDIPRLLGAFLWDITNEDVASRAPLSLAFLPYPWHTVFVKAATAAPIDTELDAALDIVEASVALAFS